MKQQQSRLHLWALVAVVLCVGPSSAQQSPPAEMAGPPAYILAAQDVVTISVWGQPELSGKYTVQPDGGITMPLVGRVRSSGLTLDELQRAVVRALMDGFVRDPRVAVSLDEIRGERVFVFGNVTAPGAYAITRGQTLIEILAKAGYGMASQAVIVRAPSVTDEHSTGTGTGTPEDAANGADSADDDVIRVNLRELEKDVQEGSLADNVVLRGGDTIFVPRVDPTRVFVSGKVRKPGAYSITEGTTVLQALALAGGATEEAAVNRLRVMRLVEGRQETFKVKLTDVLRPGDTLIVPERYF